MEFRIQLTRETAEDQVKKIKAMTPEELKALKAKEVLPMWYALCYARPDIDQDDKATWGEFDVFVGVVADRYDEGAFTLQQLEEEPLDIRELSRRGEDVCVDEELCDHCKEHFIAAFDYSSAVDLDGNDINTCETCHEEDFRVCDEPRCCAIFPKDASACPTCGGPVCTRRSEINE